MGGAKIKNKDQLSLAEARVEAELGNKFNWMKKKATAAKRHVEITRELN